MISRVVSESPKHRTPAPPASLTGTGTGRPLPLDDCYQYCESIVRAHHENFPVASRFLPERLRPHVCALYAFARSADDFADEPIYEGHRLAELDRWDDLLHRCFHGEAEHPIFTALADTVARFELPIAPFIDMLQAFRMDLTARRYATFGDLSAYTARAAQPIGRLILYVFGVRDAERHRYADDLSTALALTSFWQDTVRDLARDRVYLPQEDLRHFGAVEEDLLARRQTQAIEHLFRFETQRTRSIFQRARPLLELVSSELRVELALFWYGGRRVLDKVEARSGKIFGERATLSTVDKAFVLARAYANR